MADPLFLAIDQGTTSSRTLVVDVAGAIRGSGQETFPQYFPAPDRVEHDAGEIWAATLRSVQAALHSAAVASSELTAIGITNQRETTVVWDRATGEPVGPAIVWQDRRTAARCDELRAAGHEAMVVNTTGLTLDPYFSATKLGWIFAEQPGLRQRAARGELAAGTIDSWLIWQLTGGRRHVTDYTNASRTLLFNTRSGRWDEALCELFGVPPGILPQAQPSVSRFGTTAAEVLGAEIPITGVAGDQQSALFGQACLRRGQVKNTYGTGCFIVANAGPRFDPSRERLLVSVGTQSNASSPEYVLEGSVFVAGSLVQWLRDELGIIASSAEVEGLAASVDDSGGVSVVPAFTGLGAPYWDPYARGAILGLTRGSTKAHIARASLEAIALSNAELLAVMERDLGAPLTELRVDGGASANNLLMQLQADFSGLPVVRPTQLETTALGAAYLAALGAGVWDAPEQVEQVWQAGEIFEPRTSERERKERLAAWMRAIGRTLDWAKPS